MLRMTPSHPDLTAALVPVWPRRLAWLGVAPLVLGTLALWLVWPPLQAEVAVGLAGYAAAVVAFLGGVHWGLAMRARQPPAAPWLWSCVPPLVGSVAIWMPARAGLVLLGAMLLVCWVVDRRLYANAGQAHWLTLRFRLTMVSALCCFLGAAAT